MKTLASELAPVAEHLARVKAGGLLAAAAGVAALAVLFALVVAGSTGQGGPGSAPAPGTRSVR